MRRVGGYLDLLALEADARAYDDVILLMRGEADAAAIARVEAQNARALARNSWG